MAFIDFKLMNYRKYVSLFVKVALFVKIPNDIDSIEYDLVLFTFVY